MVLLPASSHGLWPRAICHPLHYSLLMGPGVCLKLAAASWTTGPHGISPDHVDLHSALWNRKDPALFLWHHACSETSLRWYLPQWDYIVCYLCALYHDPNPLLLCAHSGDHTWESLQPLGVGAAKLSPLALLISWLFLFYGTALFSTSKVYKRTYL